MDEPWVARNGSVAEATERPYYECVGNEEAVFKAAYRQGLSLLLKGPTGCGKTRFVEAMAHDLRPSAHHRRVPRRPVDGRPGRQVPAPG